MFLVHARAEPELLQTSGVSPAGCKNSSAACRFNDRRRFNKYVSFIGLYARNNFSTARVSREYIRERASALASARAVTIERGRRPVEKSISSYYARALQLAVPRRKITKKKGRIDRRNRHVHYALLYGRALLFPFSLSLSLSLRTILLVASRRLGFSLSLSRAFWMSTKPDRDSKWWTGKRSAAGGR